MQKIHIISTKAITINLFLENLISNLKKKNKDCTLWTSDPENLNYPNIKKNRLYIFTNFLFLINPFKLFKCLFKLRQLIKANKKDIFLINTPLVSHLFRIASIGLNIKTIYFVHGFRFHKCTMIIYYWFFFIIEYILSFLTHKYIVINNEDEKIIHKYLKKKFIKVNGVGIDLYKDQQIKNTFSISKKSLKIIVIGVYKKTKGYDDVIWLATNLKDDNLFFNCYGYGDLNNFKNKITKLNLKNIHLNKFDQNLKEKLKNYNLIVHLSQREGLPVSIMECLSVGIPVIGYNIRGLNDLIINKYNGFLYPINKKEKILNKLKEISKDQSKLLDLSKNAFNSLNYSYSKEYISNQIIDFIEAE